MGRLPNLTPFGQFLETHGIATVDAATQLGLTRQHISGLKLGRVTPSLRLAFKIRRWTSTIAKRDPVTVDSWEPWA